MATATKSKTKTNIKPLDDRVLVKPQEAEAKTASGIILPEGAKEKPMTAVVLAVGPGKLGDDGKRTPVSVKVGDVILFGKYSGTEIELEGNQHMILRESELLGVIEK